MFNSFFTDLFLKCFQVSASRFFSYSFSLIFYYSISKAWQVTAYINSFLLYKTFILIVLAPRFPPRSLPCRFTRQINLIGSLKST